ncbi:MAG: hypothetical protein LBF40_10280 [Deltaproteobacteria bacterium]|jgi:hypothetical protein|nr:hypothetical protein [Deltaproteobacteria bacterium]
MFFACVPISDSVTDYMNDSGCRPVNENCLGSPEKFFAQPQMRALETWRGRNVSELITEWGYPDKVDKQTGGQPGERYIYVEEYNVSGDMRYAYDYRFNDWDWTREPNRRYRCETYMLVSPEGKLTPLWVNRFGICTRFFNPRPEAPPRKTEQKS